MRVCQTSVLLHLTEADALAVLIRVGDISVRLRVRHFLFLPNDSNDSMDWRLSRYWNQ